MNDLWQEHRRFIVSLVAGSLVTLIAWLVIGGIYSGDIKRYERRISKAKSSQRRALKGVRLRDVRARRVAEEAAYERIRKTIERVPDEGFGLPSGAGNADLYYSRQIDSVRRDVVELCALRDIDVDRNLGLPDRFPASLKEKDWYLAGLDVVRQILLLALSAEQEMEGGIARIDGISIQQRPKARRGKRSAFLKLLPVNLSIVGHPRAVDHVLRALPLEKAQDDGGPTLASRPGRFLAVIEANVVSLDQPPGSRRGRRSRFVDPADARRVRLDLRVAAVMLEKEERP